MTKSVPTSLLFLALLSAPALAQDFVGSYDLEGRYSTRRGTAAEVTISKTASGLEVSRTGRFTGRRFRNVPPFTWTSSDVKQAGRVLRVTFTLDKDGAALGVIDQLDPDSTTLTSGQYRDVRRASVLQAYYRLSANGDTLNELIVNVTRRESEDWWYWCRTSGQRTTPVTPTPTGFVDQFRARGITDPAVYYHFNVEPRNLTLVTDRDATEGYWQDPSNVTYQRIALMRSMIWEQALRWRVNSDGRLEPGSAGEWRVGQVTDPSDGEVYDIVHWRDIDDNSFSFYWKDGVLYSRYYEN